MTRKSRELSPIQHKVLALLREAGRPLSAYDLLNQLRQDGISAPPTVYRALDKLVRQGLAHRIETLSAFIACDRKHHRDSHAFLICESCGQVSEQPAPGLDAPIAGMLEITGFEARKTAIEVSGVCSACSADRHQAA